MINRQTKTVTHDLAFTLWHELGGRPTYAGLAERLRQIYGVEVSVVTIRKWASRYGWKNHADAAKHKEQAALIKMVENARQTLQPDYHLTLSEAKELLGYVLLAITTHGGTLLCANVRESFMLAKECARVLQEAKEAKAAEEEAKRQQSYKELDERFCALFRELETRPKADPYPDVRYLDMPDMQTAGRVSYQTPPPQYQAAPDFRVRR